jgi:hypothetical protein
MTVMTTWYKQFVPAVLLLATQGALANPPQPEPEAATREVLRRVPVEAPPVEEQLRALSQSVKALEAEVQQLQAQQANRFTPLGEFGGPNDHPLWP